MQSPLSVDFYNRHAVTVAQELLGKKLVFGQQQGIITETEAYRGSDDAASHAFKGPTARASIMFGPPGYSYVYLIYGMYYCLNIVTEAEGQPSAVLLRGLLLDDQNHLNGPGKLCRHLGITKQQHGINLIEHPEFYVSAGLNDINYKATPRVGIKKAQEKLWRFVLNTEFLC